MDRELWDKTWSHPYGRYNRHHQEIWKAMEGYLEGKIADLGCGAGMIYVGKDVDLTGVDYSQEALNQAKKNYPQGQYVLADCRNTGLLSGIFDTVVMFGLLDYFEDWTEVLNEAKRIKKPNGKIFATLYHGFNNHDWSRFKRITGEWRLYSE